MDCSIVQENAAHVYLDAGNMKQTSKRVAPACALQQTMELTMNDQQFDQSQELVAAAMNAGIPDEIQGFSQKGVAMSRKFYRHMNVASIAQAKALRDFIKITQAGLESMSERIGANAAANTEAAFEAAQAIAVAKTLPEAGRLQAEFVQRQFDTATRQAQELMELSIKISQRTFEAASEIAFHSLDEMTRSYE